MILDPKRLCDSVSGFTNPHQLRCLYDACLGQDRVGDILEIGSWFGRTTIALALAAKERDLGETVWAVDPMTDDDGAPYEVGMRPGGSTLDGFLDNVASWGVETIVRLVQTTSDAADMTKAVPPTVRFALIDGDHRRAAARRDMEWARRLGATLFFLDDFGNKGPTGDPWGVEKAAKEVFGESLAGMRAHDRPHPREGTSPSLVSLDLDGRPD